MRHTVVIAVLFLATLGGCCCTPEQQPNTDVPVGYAVAVPVGCSFDETNFVELPMAPTRWRKADAGLPEGTWLGSFDASCDPRQTPPAVAVRLRRDRHGLPAGALLPFEGEPPDTYYYEPGDLSGELIWILSREPVSVRAMRDEGARGVHDIPPALPFAQSAPHAFDDGRLAVLDGWPTAWRATRHTAGDGCKLPPNPIYGWTRDTADVPPDLWCIRKKAKKGIPEGAMFGISRVDEDGIPRGEYDVEPYTADRPRRWLFRYK